ncbi:NAD(P)/FAD-dependent oxidoreductase [Nitratiruptor sp. YY09-18]|uniref:NAD(P)/FAD-dependent oxidoreductase n=1 Tax=Nitratiruptor sp. YY09-18 TaxID=2724901 RepID=UPI0019153D48|nr:FAD/NAD(P)-binding oxidoreductase [Nitratiruptor sp. YY09-18]BCD67306.1 sulfide:quinone oxidoreductase [Nitratiruptor sp. YY09-18]
MDKKDIKNFKNVQEVIEETLKSEGLSRRDALKIMGLSTAGVMVGSGSARAEEPKNTSKAKAHIVIVGGGAGGIMAAARLRRAASNAKITLIAPNEIHLYQPGQVFMAAGLYTADEIKRPNKDFVPDGVNWVKDKVVEFDPDNNQVVTAKNGKIKYDFLVVGVGISYQYEQIEGLTTDMLGKNGIASVYYNNPETGSVKGGEITWEWFKQMRAAAEKASPNNPLNVICTQPATPIKCGGAPQKILYLSDDFLRGNGPMGGADVHKNAKFYFTKGKGSKLFGIKSYNDTLEKHVQPMYGNIENKWNHNLIKIDPVKKVATFHHTYQVKGEWDPDLEDYDYITKEENVEMPYDFIHIVPPMTAANEFKNSPLAWQKGSGKGWLAADRYTLQHIKYKNVFGIGDVLGIPLGKTGGSARHHGPIIQENLVAVMEGKEPKAKFDGYTVCPLKTQYGKIMLAEFNYDGPAPTFSFLDPAEPRWIWWAFDLYMLKPMYWNLMLRGLM